MWVCGAGIPTSPARSPSPSDRDSALSSADPPRRRDEGSPPRADGNTARRSPSRFPRPKGAPSQTELAEGYTTCRSNNGACQGGASWMRVPSGTLQLAFSREDGASRTRSLHGKFVDGYLGAMYGGMDAEWNWGPAESDLTLHREEERWGAAKFVPKDPCARTSPLFFPRT